MSPGQSRILVVDDEASIVSYLRDVLAEEGYAVFTAADAAGGLAAAEREAPHLALVDLVLPDRSGLEVLKSVRERLPETRVLMMTAFATVETALEAMKLGALDYLIKPFAMDELKLHVRRALGEVALAREVLVLRREVERGGAAQELLGDSPAIRKVMEMVRAVAADASTVLITGDTGTGKELVARALHRLGPRSAAPFLAANCGAMPESLLERELFGNERGAYTGADAARPGLLEAAGDGTLFLDEIGDMSPSLQVKLLRVLDGHEFLRVGGTRPLRSRVRFVAATNQDLGRAVAEKRFREDLFYRLNVVRIELPPLRARAGDVMLLADHFLAAFAATRGSRIKAYAPEARRLLAAYAWPGNVRELRNVIERAVILARGPELGPEDLHLGGGTAGAAVNRAWLELPFKEAKRLFERAYVEHALQASGGNVTRAAAATGLDRKNLQGKVRRYKLRAG